MRINVLKKHSTKPERIVAELLKDLHIPFQFRHNIGKYEVDFLIGTLVIEVGNHNGNPVKNGFILSNGYDLLDFSNTTVLEDRDLVREKIIKFYGNKSNERKRPSIGRSN